MASLTIQIPDDLYQGLLEAADRERKTPAEWIIGRLPRPAKNFPEAKTMYDILAPHIGQFSSDNGQPSLEHGRETFDDSLEEKHVMGDSDPTKRSGQNPQGNSR
jgi:hypothetical protein